MATQKPELRKRLKVDHASRRLANSLDASVELMKVMARACGHNHLNQFQKTDLTTWKAPMARLAGIEWNGFDPQR